MPVLELITENLVLLLVLQNRYQALISWGDFSPTSLFFTHLPTSYSVLISILMLLITAAPAQGTEGCPLSSHLLPLEARKDNFFKDIAELCNFLRKVLSSTELSLLCNVIHHQNLLT